MDADARTASASGGTAAHDAAVLREIEQFYLKMPQMVALLHRRHWAAGMTYQDAQDCIQDAFVELLRWPDRVGSPFSWVITVARRRWTRNHQRMETLVDTLSPVFDRADAVPAPEDRLVTAEAESDLIQEIKRLNVPDGRYLISYALGASLTTMAQDEGVSEDRMLLRINTARRIFHRRRLSVHTRRLAAAPQPARQARPGAAAEAMLDALATLPPRQREVLDLAVDGMRPREIATVVGLTPNAVRVNLHHAKKKVAERLGTNGKQVLEQLRRLGNAAAFLADTA